MLWKESLIWNWERLKLPVNNHLLFLFPLALLLCTNKRNRSAKCVVLNWRQICIAECQTHWLFCLSIPAMTCLAFENLILHNNSSMASRLNLKWIVTVPPECFLSSPLKSKLTERHQIWLSFVPLCVSPSAEGEHKQTFWEESDRGHKYSSIMTSSHICVCSGGSLHICHFYAKAQLVFSQ